MVFVAALGLIAALTINNLSSHVDQYSDLLEREVKAALLIDTVNLTFKRQVQEWFRWRIASRHLSFLSAASTACLERAVQPCYQLRRDP